MSTHGLSGPHLPAITQAAGASRAAAAVVPAIKAAAARAGVDFGALFNTARLESGFNPSARAASSSATGLFQFIDSTWLSMLKRHGAALGVGDLPQQQALSLRTDPHIASFMAAEHMADNAATLQQALGRAAGATDLYLAHFLGAGGAVRFLRRLADTPEMPGASILPAAAKANRAIFYANGAPRTLDQIHRLLGDRLAGQVGRQDAAPPAAISAQPAVGGSERASSPSSLDATARAAQPAMPVSPAQAARVAYLLLAEMGA